MLKKSFLNPAVLGGLLAVQVVVAIVVFWPGTNENNVEVKPLLAIDDSINRIEVRAQDQTVVLNKKDDQWQVAEGLPVNQQRVDALLEKLTSVKTGWPVGTSVEAQERFQVTEDNFSRKIHLYADDKSVYEVYLGSIVNLKQTHIRLAGDDNIYAGAIAVYEIPTILNSWMDTTLLRPEGEITAIRAGEFSITKSGDAWPGNETETNARNESEATHDSEVAGAPVEQETRTFSAAAFSQTLRNLRVNGVDEGISVLNVEETDNQQAGSEAFVKTEFVVSTSETTYRYELLRRGDEYYLRRDDYKSTFKIGKVQFDELILIASAQA